MEVKIGIQSVPRDSSWRPATTAEEVERALKPPSPTAPCWCMPDDKGGKILVPADKIAYMEISDSQTRRVGLRRQLCRRLALGRWRR